MNIFEDIFYWKIYYKLSLCFRWVTQFRDIFDADNYHPVQVNSLLEYRDITESFPYDNSALENSPFPKQFPFSAMVPRVYTEVQEFIISCLQFSEDLQLTQAELGMLYVLIPMNTFLNSQ